MNDLKMIGHKINGSGYTDIIIEAIQSNLWGCSVLFPARRMIPGLTNKEVMASNTKQPALVSPFFCYAEHSLTSIIFEVRCVLVSPCSNNLHTDFTILIA